MSAISKASLEALRDPILAVLRRSDLTSISAKKVRQALAELKDPRQPSQRLVVTLQVHLDDKDHKKQVDGLIRECFDVLNDEPNARPTSSGNGHVAQNGNGSSAATTPQPAVAPRIALPGMGGIPGSHANKNNNHSNNVGGTSSSPSFNTPSSSTGGGKRSRKNDDVISDDEEDVEAVKRKAASSSSAKKATTTSKPAKKRKSSGADDGEKAPPNPNNPFNRPVVLSDEMSKICGGKEVSRFRADFPLERILTQKQMPRYMITKQLWAYIKDRDLQNPSNKRQILCDPTLTHLFGKSTVDSFEMAKLITKHVTKKVD